MTVTCRSCGVDFERVQVDDWGTTPVFYECEACYRGRLGRAVEDDEPGDPGDPDATPLAEPEDLIPDAQPDESVDDNDIRFPD